MPPYFSGEDADVQKIRNLTVSLSNAQLITTTKIVEGDAKEVAEDLGMTKYVITEDESGGNAIVTEDPAAATLANIENPEAYSSDISGDNASDDANLIKCIYAADQPPNPIDINSTEGVSSSHTTISPLYLVTKILKSPESLTESANLDVESESSCFHGAALNSTDLLVSKFYGEKTTLCKSSTKKGNSNLEIRHEKSREIQWVRLGKSSLSKFDRNEIDGGNRLNDRHINYAQAMMKYQFSLEALQCTLFQNS